MKKIIGPILEMLETIIVAVVVVFLIRTYIVQPFLVNGESMYPTFNNGDYLLVDEITYRIREPQRGEVIVFRYPNEPSSYFIKRIIGLPKETVIIYNDKVEILNDKNEKIYLNENYITAQKNNILIEKKLGEDEYFVMGDNRNYSFDSRNWGPLKKKNIIGLVRLRLWPLNAVKAFSPPVYEFNFSSSK